MDCLRLWFTFVRRRFAFVGSCITLLKVTSPIWTVRPASLARRVRTKPDMYSSFIKRRVSGDAQSEHLPRCPNLRTSTPIQAQPIIHIGIILQWATRSIACLWTWLIWGVMAHRKWKLIYASVKDAQDCKKDVSNGYQYKRSMHLKQHERQCKTEVTNTFRT